MDPTAATSSADTLAQMQALTAESQAFQLATMAMTQQNAQVQSQVNLGIATAEAETNASQKVGSAIEGGSRPF